MRPHALHRGPEPNSRDVILSVTNTRSILILALAMAANIVGLGIVVPVLPFQVTALGGQSGAVPLIFSAFSMAAILGAPFWGWLSDRVGRKPVLLTSALLTILSYIWLAHVESLTAIYASRILAGLSAGWFTASAAYVADVTTDAERAKGMGFLGAAFGAGFTVGPGLGAWLAGGAIPDYAVPAYAAAVATLVSALLVIAVLREPVRKSDERPVRFATEALKDADVSLLLILHFAVHLVFTAMEGVFAIWAATKFGLGAREVGYYLAFSGLVTVIVQGGVVRRAVSALGEGWVLVMAAGILAVVMLTVLMIETPLMILLPMGLLAVGMGLHNPAMQSLLSKVAPARMKGGTLGNLQSSQSLARVLGPVWGAAAFSVIGVESPFLIGFVVLGGAFIFALVLTRRFPKRVAEDA